jgi:3'(2'), 5'-bisphosphate nucleotidase
MAYDTLLTTAIHCAVAAGEAALAIYHTDFAIERKADDSPVTRADRLSHDIIEQSLGTFHIPLLSEEGKLIPYGVRKAWDLLWMVDPLDGTKEFISRNGEFTVNIALIKENKPVLGVIYVPAADRLIFAAQGLGAYALTHAEPIVNNAGQLDDKKNTLAVLMDKSTRLPSIPAQNAVLTIVGSRSHGSAEFDAFIASMREELGEVKLTPAGSSVKFCLVAEGAADIYPRFGSTMEWDTAAGQAIVENAGMHVVDLKTGVPLHYNKENLLNPWFVAGKTTVLHLPRENKTAPGLCRRNRR